MSIKDQLDKDSKEYGGSSDFFRFEKSGVYKLRILSEMKAIATHFFGKGKPSHVCFGEKNGCPFHKDGDEKASVKYICYVIDRSDEGKIKLAELPWSVVSVIADLEEDEDFKFSEYPMPYDIKVTVDKENNDPKQIYKTLGSPKREELSDETDEELAEKMKKMTPEMYVEKRKEKEKSKGGAMPEAESIDPADIPF